MKWMERKYLNVVQFGIWVFSSDFVFLCPLAATLWMASSHVRGILKCTSELPQMFPVVFCSYFLHYVGFDVQRLNCLKRFRLSRIFTWIYKHSPVPETLCWIQIRKETPGLSPRANYTDRSTTACRRSDYQLLQIEGVTWSAWQIPTAVFSVF
jgi:hypothetical protein